MCIVPGGTRSIHSIPITLPCWGYQDDYQCGRSTGDNNCKSLIEQGCQMLSRLCLVSTRGMCAQSRDTYSCGPSHCTGHANICAGPIYCLDGTCYEAKPSHSTAGDFAKAGSEVAAAAGAAHDAAKGGKHPAAIFAGSAMSCSADFVGFRDCCRNSGWGKDIHLGHCSQEEKKLGLAREKGYAFQVGGKYCAHRTKIFKICTRWRKGFCSFQGMLARDVQWQGRWGQLHIGFGSNDGPNCRGLSISELSRLNFDKIDFSNYYARAKGHTHFPNSAAIAKEIATEMKRRANDLSGR